MLPTGLGTKILGVATIASVITILLLLLLISELNGQLKVTQVEVLNVASELNICKTDLTTTNSQVSMLRVGLEQCELEVANQVNDCNIRIQKIYDILNGEKTRNAELTEILNKLQNLGKADEPKVIEAFNKCIVPASIVQLLLQGY